MSADHPVEQAIRRSHCAHADRDDAKHQCVGTCLITPSGVTLDCRACGKAIMNENVDGFWQYGVRYATGRVVAMPEDDARIWVEHTDGAVLERRWVPDVEYGEWEVVK